MQGREGRKEREEGGRWIEGEGERERERERENGKERMMFGGGLSTDDERLKGKGTW